MTEAAVAEGPAYFYTVRTGESSLLYHTVLLLLAVVAAAAADVASVGFSPALQR